MKNRIPSPLMLGLLVMLLLSNACLPPSPTPTPLANLNELQTAPGHLNLAMQEAEPETFAGLWIEQEPTLRVIALFTRDGEKTLAPYIAGSILEGRVEVRQVKYSLAELTTAERIINQMIRDSALPFSTAVDIKENKVVVYVTDQALWNRSVRESGLRLPEYVATNVIYDPLQGTPEFLVTPVKGLVFPQLRARSAMFMTALLEGKLILEDGCLRVVTSYSPESNLIIWQPDYFPTQKGDQIEILDKGGQVVARVGESIALGGGGIELSDYYTGQMRAPIPSTCAGPYFLMGSVVSRPLLTPVSTATPTLARPTITPVPSYTPKPSITAAFIPTKVPSAAATDQVTSCPGAPKISLKLNTWAYISLDPPVANNVRREPGLSGKFIGKLKPGEIVWIGGGPRCADGYTWWSVRSLAGLEGWTVEGDATDYWLIQPYDAFFYDTASQSSTSKVVLSMGQKYRITMAGTYSLWVTQQWTDPGVCIRGESEQYPMFPSPLRGNGPVGADPYYRFARPFYGPCQEPVNSDEMVSAIMLSLDGGNKYFIPDPLVAKYREDHTYTYVYRGQGYTLRVRLDDSVLDDNYGLILIIIEKID